MRTLRNNWFVMEKWFHFFRNVYFSQNIPMNFKRKIWRENIKNIPSKRITRMLQMLYLRFH